MQHQETDRPDQKKHKFNKETEALKVKASERWWLCPSLPTPQLRAWQHEMEHADDQDSRAHWWSEPHWVSMERMAQSPLLDATCSHIRLALSHLAWEEAGIRGVEFWTQRRAVDAPMHCHWDIDEALGASSGRVRCPWLSVLVYLSCAGGPTLVLDQQPVQSTRGMQGRRSARLVWPREGQVHAFGGDLLHGVLAPTSENGAAPVGRLRHTLILNFWRRRPQQVPTLPRVLCPLVSEASRGHGDAVAAPPSASGGAAHEPGRRLPNGARRSCERIKTAHWARQRLLLGMFNRHEHLDLLLPQITFREYAVEDFETIIFSETERVQLEPPQAKRKREEHR